MTDRPKDEIRCQDCPNIFERREADRVFRDHLIQQLAELKTMVSDLPDMRRDMKVLIWRVAFIAGGSGAVSGAIGTLFVMHFQK